MTALAVRAACFQTSERFSLDYHADVIIGVDATGTITDVADGGSPNAAALWDAASTRHQVPDGSYLLPGLVDLHVHAPQWPQLGTGLDLPLERWLFDYTFPLESRYADAWFAQTVWDSMVPTLLAHGTTTAVYYGTVHSEATVALAATCLRHGQRAYVGRVAMDHPEGTPTWYRDASATEGIEASASSIAEIEALSGGSGLVRPIITPRFIPACTDDLLAGLGALAAETGVLVQTHCSESDWEHQYVIERYGVTDAEQLRRFGLARDHSVLAHGGHLTSDDFATLARVGAGVAHCPLSNAYFGNAVFPVRRALAAGVRVGLGTDIAGGASPGLLPQAAVASTVSRILDDGTDAAVPAGLRGVRDSRLSAVEAFWLATVGGAEVLGAPIGLLEVGRQFDAIVVSTTDSRTGLNVWPEVDTAERIFEKIVRLAGPSDITEVWVDGKRC